MRLNVVLMTSIAIACTAISVFASATQPGTSTGPLRNTSAAQIRPAPRAEAGSATPYAIAGSRWIDRTSVNVYSTWDGGTCVLDGTDYSVTASAIDPAVVSALLQQSID